MFDEGNVILKDSQENTTVLIAKEEGTRMLLENKLEEVYPQV